MAGANSGRLIVIEGSDGSGKATQSRLLVSRLRRSGIGAVRLAFPGYRRGFFGKMVAAYLRGEYGTSQSVDPRMAAVLYAADRWQVRERINGWLAEGKMVICDRYVDSNKAHQAARLPLGAAVRPFLAWVDRLEYGVFGLPRADFTLFLHVPRKVASELISRKGRRAYLKGRARDMHEADLDHLRKAEEIYLSLARARGKRTGALIECVQEGRLLTRREIGERIWQAVAAVRSRNP